jgi:arginase
MIVDVIGVPDSAGAYCVGVEEAPRALRDAGLIEALVATGAEVVDHGDLTRRVWARDPASPLLQNLGAEVEAVAELAAAAAPLLGDGRRLLVLGGSCLVALGVVRAMSVALGRARLVDVDRHPDLNTPASTRDGSLSWMGMAHALALTGTAVELTGGSAVLSPGDLVYLGVDLEGATAWELSTVAELGIPAITQQALCDGPADAATAALARLGSGPFAVHLDVDVLDFLDAPLAEDVNGRNSGPTMAQLQAAMVVLGGDPGFRALSIGQLDPAHARADATAIPRLVALAQALLSSK